MSRRKLLLAGVGVFVAVVVGAAIVVLDSPAEERRRRLDARRVDDLHAIADAIDVYWTEEGTLPPDLEALSGWRGLEMPPTDPVTAAPYRYRVSGERSYELCARFATSDPGRGSRSARRHHRTLSHHPAGEHCFELGAEEVDR